MRLHLAFLLVSFAQGAAAQDPPPLAALRYHTALLTAPHNPTLFARFHDAWLDEQPTESLAAFLTARAEKGNGEDLAILARFQIRRGLENDAITTLNKASTARPADAALPLERARILLSRLDFNAARKDLDTAAASPDAALAIEAGKLIGKSYLREGDPAAATAAWEKLIAKHPANTEILEDLVELTATSDQPDQAIAYSRRLIAATADAFRKTQHQLRLGELLADSGKSEEALTLWSETLAQTGEGSWLEKEIIARITTAFRRLDRIDALSAKLAELAAANPRRLLIHRELALLEATEGKLDSAIGRFREVLRRSPGEAELREEFIRLLIDGQRFEDAAAELEKLISLSPENPDLHLRMADLAHRRAEADPNHAIGSPPPPEVLAALEKARSLMPPGEPSGIRIAGLMLSYDLNTQGEKLLSSLAADPNATTAPAEALAAEFTRTERKKEALEILTKVAKSPDVDTVLRASSSIASLGDPQASFAILSARLTDFPNQPSYLAALAQASIAAKKASEAITPALRLVRLATLPQEILDATRLATSVITASEKTDAEIASLTARNDRTPSETCLLATLLGTKSDSTATDALFKNSTDPTLLRFHASLLSRRSDPHAAIAALRRLNKDSSKPDFLKELSELQLRAGLIPECLATLDEWQTAAPTAREPWIISARLLRESGKHAEAIETTRRALTRFPGDEDFTSSLADLHQLSGDNAEAERIFWKLYDQAQDSTAQSRWAARLSMLAQRTGSTAELAEKFLARARSNSRSTGPVLALVELARAAGDREAIRAHLARALFIKPGDIEIRIQLAEAEAAAGNPQARITILTDGLTKDPAGRLRTALAQAHIDNGEVLKGMRILRALAGERASDPRSVETVAFSLYTKSHVSEAIQYLREALPDGGDWRSKYLLATMLVEDGRELEAVPVFLSLLTEESEITNIPQSPNSNFDPYLQLSRRGQLNPALSEISILSQVAQTASRPNDYRQANISQSLPTSLAHLRASALVRLAFIASSGNHAASEAITAARPPGLAFVTDLIASYKTEQVDFLTLLEKYPDQPGLFDLAWQTGNFHQGIEKSIPLLKRILATTKPDASVRLYLLATLARLEPEEPQHWDNLIAAAQAAILADNAPEANAAAVQLLTLITGETKNFSPERIAAIKELLLTHATKPTQGSEFNHTRLSILACVGTRDQWIAEVNSAIATHRSAPKTKPIQNGQLFFSPWDSRSSFQRVMYGNLHSTNLPFSSIPAGLTYHIASQKIKDEEGRNRVTALELLTQLDRLDSPLLRAYVAYLSGDEKAIAETFAAPHPEAEDYDFAILRAARESAAERHVEAFRIYAKLLESIPENPQRTYTLHSTLIAIATKLTPQQRAEFEQPLRAALKGLIPPPGLYRDVSGIIEQAKQFGFEDMVKSLTPAPPTRRNPTGSGPARIGLPAAITPPSSRRQQQASFNPLDRFRDFAREGKDAAAAREFLKWVGSMRKSGNTMAYAAREASQSMTPAIKTEILAIADPGSSPSLTKHRAYIDICLALGDREKALAALNSLAAARPFDATVTCDLAFLLPPAESARANELLTAAAGSPYLSSAINSTHDRIWETREKSEVFAFIERIASLLEAIPPAQNPRDVLNQISNISRDFFSSNTFPDTLPLIPEQSQANDKRQPPDANHIAIARRLAIAMLRHPTLADSGFGFLKSASWEEKPGDLDEWARSAILLVATQGRDYRHYNSSSPYPGKSPIDHLLARLAASTPDLLPATYLDALAKHDPHLPTLLRFHSTPATTESIAALWDSGAMESSQSSSIQALQQAAYKRAATAPGASRFFLTRIRELSKKENSKEPPADPYGQGRPAVIQLLRAAMECCPSLDEKGVNEVCNAIIAYCFPPKDQPDPDYRNEQQAINTLQQVFGNFSTDLRTAARILRCFDASSTPLDPNWLQTNLRELQKMKAPEAVEALASMGLLADTASWKPFVAHYADYDHSSSPPKYTRKRNDQLPYIANNLYSSSREEIAKLLESRKPQTFGSLITAASFANGSERQRLATAAFLHANPVLIKASARRLDDFALLIPLLPHSATATLPPRLREIALKNRAELAASLAKTAEQQIEQAIANSQNPLGNITNYCAQLAPLDLPKSVEIFLKATETYLASSNLFANQGNTHDDSLHRILYEIGSSESRDPETALRFYQAVLSNPIGARFGITPSNDDDVLLSSIGQSFVRSSSKSPSKHSEIWLAAAKMPETLRQDALASVACYTLKSGNYPSHEQALKMFANISDPKIRSLAIAATCIRNSVQKEKPEAATEITQSFVALLTNPDFNASARTQIALTAASSIPQILQNPATSEVIADIFVTYCSRDASVVSPLPLRILSNLANQEISPDAIPQLKRINEAFWKNANSPLPGGHQPISEGYTAPLFQTAIKLGDSATANRLFPLVRSSLLGNLDSIASLILSDHFDIATKLIPDQDNPFYYNRSIYMSADLEQKLNTFYTTLKNPEQALRLRCNMSRLFKTDSNQETKNSYNAYLNSLIEIYRKNPPKNSSTNIEVLFYIATPLRPTQNTLDNEIITAASSLNVKTTLNNLTSDTDYRIEIISQHQHEFHVLRQAAMLRLLNGDPSLFISLCNEFSSYAKKDSRDDVSRLLSAFSYHPKGSPLTTFISSTAQWISLACARGKTDSFSQIILPLRKLTFSCADSKNDYNNHHYIYDLLAIHSFVSHWEDKPEDLTPHISKNPRNEYTVKRFTTLHDGIAFFNVLRDTRTFNDTPNLDSEHLQFMTAVFSRQSLTPILLSRYSYPGLPHNSTDEIPKLIANLPDTLSPTGKLLVRYQHASTISIPKNTLEPYRSLIKDIPNTPQWLSFQINCKLNLITKLLYTDSDTIEARQIIDSIEKASIPEDQKKHCEIMLQKIEAAEKRKR